ncbi:MAG: alpha/beta fold hydrolase [Comamonas sp.]
MNARWQQASILGGLLLALAWLWWQWPRSPALALAGVVALVLLPAWSVTLQFLCMRAAPRDADASIPAVGLGALLRAWRAEVALACRIFGWRQPFRHRVVADTVPEEALEPVARTGVVLVHGYLCNRAFWQPWQRLLAARGIPCMAVTLEPVWGSIDDCAPGLDAAVRRMTAATGRAPVLIGHSMGGLVIRAWLRSRGAVVCQGLEEADAGQRLASLVAHVITIGTPHQGTALAEMSRSANGRQMRQRSDWLLDLARHEPQALAARMTCWYSNCDNLVFPARAACYPGADNRLVVDLAHVQMAFEPRLMQDSLALVKQA